MKQHRSFSEWTVRLLCLLLGLYILAQGIAFTILANLGTDAITSPALVAHMVLGKSDFGMGYEFCTVGYMLICIHCLLPVPNYAASMAYTLLGCIVCAFGIYTFVKADMIPLSAEGLCLALSRTFNWRFSRVKVAVDCTLIAAAVLASWILLGRIEGVREGSLICAVSTGFIIGWFFRFCPLWDKVFAAVGHRPVDGKDVELA